MNIAEIEGAIVAKLKSDIPEFSVDFFPSDVKDYEVLHPKGVILVGYEGSNFTNPQLEQQSRLLEFDVVVIIRNLKTHKDAYDVLDRARRSVTNELYVENSRFYAVSEKFLFVDGDKWFYELRFLLPTIHFNGE